MDFLNHMEGGGGYGFLSGFSPFFFTVYINRTVEIHKRLREFENIRKRLPEFEEIEISRQSCRGDCEYQGGNLLRICPDFCLRIRPLGRECWASFQRSTAILVK
jgi:hypothetical protein